MVPLASTSAMSVDATFALVFFLMLLIGYWRGLRRELLQLVLFMLMALVSLLVLDESIEIHQQADILPTLKFVGWFALGMYALTFLLSRLFILRFLRQPLGQAERLAGALFAAFKLAGMLLALNFAYAVVNPNADRMSVMPQMVQESAVLTTSDAVTEILYRQLAAWDVVTYRKITYRPKTREEIQQERLEEQLGIEFPKKPW